MTVMGRILLYERLSLFLRSGIPIHASLQLLGSTADGTRRALLARVEESIRSGVQLSVALPRAIPSIPVFEIHLIRLGEQSGNLSLYLAQAATLLRKRRVVIRKVRTACVYPLIIICGAGGVLTFLMLYALPKIVPIFRSFGTVLPLSTKVLMVVSSLFASHGMALLLAALLLTTGVGLGLRTARIRRMIQKLTLQLPFVRDLSRTYYSGHISRTLSILLGSGTPLIPSLVLVREGIEHHLYQKSLETLRKEIEHGNRFSHSLGSHPELYHPSLVELAAAGEASGSLSKTLGTAADLFEEDLAETINLLTDLVEPVLMVFMGLIIGFVAMAIVSPIYSITNTLNSP
jgi:type IV pilus assembly protein PilC